MLNAAYHGMGEILQGNTLIGEYHYELAAARKGTNKRLGVVYIGDREASFSALVGKELGLRLADGSLCTFRITDVASKMTIVANGPKPSRHK